MFLTKKFFIQTIQELRRDFATKDDIKSIRNDLKGFATKDDLKGFATKDDLKGFATKDDLKGFATKDDLKGMKNDLLDAMRENNGYLIVTMDQMIDKKLDDKINPAINSLKKVISEHSRRIQALEDVVRVRC